MAQFSKTDQKRLTFLSLLSSAATLEAGTQATEPEVYALASVWLDQMEDDGFFEQEVGRSDQGRPTSRPSGGQSRPSGRQASGSSTGNRGRDRQGGGGYNGQMRDPDGPPTDKQVGKLLSLTEDYSEADVLQMTKLEVSQLIDDLLN